MASERRAQVVRLAEILGVEFERSLGTAELMEMCVTEADCRMGSGASEGDGSEDEPEDESEEESDDEGPPAGMRPALRSVPTASASATSSRRKAPTAPEHRAGGNGKSKLRKAAERFESERGQRFERQRLAEGSIRASNGAILHATGIVPKVRAGATFYTQEDQRILEVPEGMNLALAHAAVGLPAPRVVEAEDEDQDEGEDAQEDAEQEDTEDAQEVAPVLAQSRRERRGMPGSARTRKAS